MRRVIWVLVMAVAVGSAGCGRPTTDASVEGAAGATTGGAPVASASQAQGFSGIFPFTTREELDAYAAGTDQVFRDPVRTAREFAVRYLGFTTPDLADGGFQEGEPGAGEVPIGVQRNGQLLSATTVVVRQLGPQGATGPWTVIASANARIQVDGPDPLQRISSPVTVSGQADAFEGTVNVEVREDGMVDGQSLGTGFVTAVGQGGPFSGQITFRAPTKPGGAVVFQDRSGSGVGETDAFATSVVRVVFGAVPRTG